MYWETRDSDDPVLKENYKKAKAQHSKLVANSKENFFRRKTVQVPITRELQV